MDVVGLGLLLGGDERGVWVVIGVEGLVDGLPPFLEAGLAGDLDGDPAQDHRCYGDHGGRDGCHLSLSLTTRCDVRFRRDSRRIQKSGNF